MIEAAGVRVGKMIPRSIRWRLPLTYAGIAMLATLALGLVLLVTLRTYYRGQERDYLLRNAEALGPSVSLLMEDAPAEDALRSYVAGFSYLSQTKVRVLDADRGLVADSGDPREAREFVNVSLGIDVGGVTGAFTQTVEDAPSKPRQVTSTVELESKEVRVREKVVVTGLEPDSATDLGKILPGERRASPLAALGAQTGFELNPYAAPDGGRSSQVVRMPVYSEVGVELVGYVELSEGPAFGREILKSVAVGWAVSGSVATAVATAVGWLISLRLSGPLVGLTRVTEQMAGGDLATRADIRRSDELGRLAGSFNEMAQRVEDTVSTLRRFVADAAHEVHTPLTALRTNLDLISREKHTANVAAAAERARSELDRLEGLATGLLELSRLETGPVEANFETQDLVSLVREVVEPYASRAEQAELSFSVDLPSEPLDVRGDDSQLRQAVANLLDNAVKFTPGGGGVSVALAGDGGSATLVVADSGIGVPEADMSLLFGRFHRGRNASPFQGNGLGLAIVQAIVQAHGGSVSAENIAPGARFTIKLSRL